MFETFEKYLTEKADLTIEEIGAIRAVSIEKKITKRQYLLQEGDVCHYNCFIVKGCLRLYRIGEGGTEHILRFASYLGVSRETLSRIRKQNAQK